ncbi:MAG TPA: hypothetical protein VIM56_16910 [Rhizomicrobium sp.]
MRKTTIALMAGALALAGTAAFAANNDVHHMTVRLADGSVANIAYIGDVAPKIRIVPQRSLADFAPGFGAGFGFAPFGNVQQIDAMMDAQMRTMQQQINAMMAMPFSANAPIEAAFGKMPAGSHFCAQSVRITTDANGKQNIERKSSGDCGGSPASAPAEHSQPHHGDTI